MMATHRRTWQKFEQRAAAFFGAARRVLSGSANRADLDGDDSTHERLWIECKLREAHSVCRIWDAAAKLARKAAKWPVVCLAEKNRPGFWVVVHSDDFRAVAAEYLAACDEADLMEFEAIVRVRRLGINEED